MRTIALVVWLALSGCSLLASNREGHAHADHVVHDDCAGCGRDMARFVSEVAAAQSASKR